MVSGFTFFLTTYSLMAVLCWGEILTVPVWPNAWVAAENDKTVTATARLRFIAFSWPGFDGRGQVGPSRQCCSASLVPRSQEVSVENEQLRNMGEILEKLKNRF